MLRFSAVFLCLLVSIAFSHNLSTRADEKTKPAEATTQPDSIAVKFAEIKAEHDAQQARAYDEVGKIQDQAKARKRLGELLSDDVVYSRRMVEIASTAPRTAGARDALLWVIDHPGRSEAGPFGDEYSRAVALLVRHHGDDPDAIRIGLGLDNVVSSQRDALLYGFLVTARSRESMGLARLALAQYLSAKARYAKGTRNAKERGKRRWKESGDDGMVIEKERDQPAEDFAYILSLRQIDPEKLRAESERLFEEVISDYSDIPYATLTIQRMEAFARQPNPTFNGKSLTEAERNQLAEFVAKKKTLGQVAEARLDDMRNLAVGRPAPEISGVDFDGKSLKLSDYRGKVVVLVFWGTWCGPCMGEVPRERELVERLKDKPFAMLGVNCDGDKNKAVQVMASERITWPNWHDGAPDTGAISQLYHVRGYPSILVLDGKGIIRHKGLRGESIDKAVDDLLVSMATK